MSRDQGPVGLSIEWSPRGVVAYDHATRQTRAAEDLPGLGLGGRSAVLALSRRGVFVRTARVPNAGASEVRLILMMQVGDLFPLPAIDLAWDFALTEDVNEEGRLAVLAAIPCSDLRRALDAAAAAGVKVRAAVPLATGSTLIAQELGLAEAAVIERAQDGPAVDIVSGGALRASRAAPPSATLELEVTRALGLAGIEFAPTVAAGGADVPNAQRQTERTALMALADAPFDRLTLKLDLPEAVAAEAAAAGRRQMRRASLVLVLSAVFALTAGLNFSDAKKAADAEQTRANAKLQRQKNDVKKATAESGRQVAMREALDLAFAPAQKISDILAVSTTALPTGAWLNAVAIERGKPASLRGISRSESAVVAFVKNLDTQRERRFRDVQLTNANHTLVNKTPVTIFVVSAFPVGNLPFLTRPGAAKGSVGR